MLLRSPLIGEPFYRRNREFHAEANQFPERSDTSTLIVQEGFGLVKKNSCGTQGRRCHVRRLSWCTVNRGRVGG